MRYHHAPLLLMEHSECPLPHITLTRREMALLGVLFALAAFARLERIEISNFRYDEGILSGMATSWLQGGAFPTRGLLASVGLPQGPLMVYLIAIPYALFSTPLAATAFVSVLNIGGVLLLWALARRMFSPTVAWFAAFMYAASPWAVHYSRKIWNPNMHTPLLLAAMLLAWMGVGERKRPWMQILAVALALVIPQFHYQGWLLLPVFAIIFWQGRRFISWPAVMAGIILAVVMWLPLITSLTAQDIETFRSVSSARGEKTLGLSDRPLGYVINMVTGWYIDEQTVGPDSAAEIASRLPVPGPEWGILLVLFGVGVLAGGRRYGRGAAAIYVWAFLTPLILTPDWTRISGHYFTLILPALCLFVGFGAEQIIGWGRNRTAVNVLLCGIVGLVLLSQTVWRYRFVTELDTAYVKGGLGTPLRYLMDVRAALQSYDDVLIIGGNPFVPTDSSIWKPLLYNQASCVRDLVIAGGNVAVLPDHPFAVMVASYAAPYSLRDFYTQTPAQVVPLRPDEDPYTIHAWDTAPEWTETTITTVTALPFENGVRLTGYSLVSQSIYLQWHIDAAGSRDNVQYFAHFFNAAGDKIGQRDSSFYDVQYWCTGDTIITRVDLDAPIPDGTVKMSVGMYRLVEGKARGLGTIDEAGQPAAGTIDIDVP